MRGRARELGRGRWRGEREEGAFHRGGKRRWSGGKARLGGKSRRKERSRENGETGETSMDSWMWVSRGRSEWL